MCGIVGGAGKISFRKYLLTGLSKLDYRGYDSAGLAFTTNGSIQVYKTVGRVSDLDLITPKDIASPVGIAHTRWATHGEPSTINAHPQLSKKGTFAIVHNGVIENFRALKNNLKVRGYTFKSDTDTEIVADILEIHYLESHDVLKAIRQTMSELEGSYACAIIHQNDNKVYFMKKASPLLLGVGEGANYLASDPAPMVGLAKKYVDLDDGDYGYVDSTSVHVYLDGKEIVPSYSERSVDLFKYDLNGYPYFMLKEIEESPSVIHRLLDNYFDGRKWLFDKKMLGAIDKADDVVFIGCGTSYYACLLGVEYVHYLGKRSEAYIASEWAYYPVASSKKTIYILLSQSGETADLILCQKYINDNGLTNIAITNTKGSTIERKSTYSILLYAGLEVAVASTKSYVAQVVMLAMITSALTKTDNTSRHLSVLIDCLNDIIARKEEIHDLAKKIYKARDAFYVGRGYDYCASLECALKLKEISYIHAEAYPSGELKHGPIALIEKETPVIGLVSDQLSTMATRNNIVELSSRGANTFIVSTKALAEDGDAFLVKDVKTYLSAIPKVVFGQYLSYYVSLEKKLPIDKPRNLAKSVTVE
jgi:glucosamine--fructose-6-phosphate aminotransferase (isomerizing)